MAALTHQQTVEKLFERFRSKYSTLSSTGSAVPFWGDAPDLWDNATVDGLDMPGLVEVRGEGFEQKIERVKSAGKKGEAHRFVGTASVDFELVCHMWTQEDLDQFITIIKYISTAPPPKKVVKRVDQPTPQTGTVFDATGQGNEVPLVGAYNPVAGSDFLANVNLVLQNAGNQSEFETTYVSGGPRTVQLYHPALEIFGIRAATIMKLGLPVRSHNDSYTSTFKCSQLHLGNRDCGTGLKTAPGSLANGLGALVAPSAPTPSASLTGPKR